MVVHHVSHDPVAVGALKQGMKNKKEKKKKNTNDDNDDNDDDGAIT